LTFATSQAAWFKLGEIPAQQTGALQLTGAVIDMLPADVNGTLAGLNGTDPITDGVSWGRRDGLGAALVIGRNLPGNVGQWHSGPADIPGILPSIDRALQPPEALASLGVRRYTRCVPFPPGALNDSTPYRQSLPLSFGLSVDRFEQLDRLGVALVVDPRSGLGGAGVANRVAIGILAGYASATLYLQSVD